mmetsp:Transcript_49274/g.143430  ORF Transcript_49274/g.143430 Transcript_49274/m.143430 type:complete len:263 (-) Transcript_49274:62-850(-)
MVELPPGAWEKRDDGSGVSSFASRWAWRWANNCAELSAPNSIVLCPPTGPRVGTALTAPPPPSSMQLVPPGAWGKRCKASGVSTTAERCASCCAHMSAEQWPPRTTVAAPPIGPRGWTMSTGASASNVRERVSTPPTGPLTKAGASSTVPPKHTVERPPGACGKRDAGSGVSIPAIRRLSSSANMRLESSLPKVTVSSPPTGPRVHGRASCSSAPRSPSTMVVAPPTGPLTACGSHSPLSPRHRCDMPPGACGKRAAASGGS